MMARIIGGYLLGALLVVAGYGLGVRDTMGRISELCKPGASWVADGIEYQCTVTTRPILRASPRT